MYFNDIILSDEINAVNSTMIQKRKTTLKMIRITNGSSFILVLYFVQIDTRDSKDVRLYCILEEIVEKKRKKKN